MADIVGALDAMNDIEIASDAPLTEALHTKYGANVNELIKAYMPVGSIIHSLLTEAEVQAEIGSTSWVIARVKRMSLTAEADSFEGKITASHKATVTGNVRSGHTRILVSRIISIAA